MPLYQRFQNESSSVFPDHHRVRPDKEGFALIPLDPYSRPLNLPRISGHTTQRSIFSQEVCYGKGKSLSEEFKEEAVRLSQTSGKSVARVARELGISQHTLYDWRRRAISSRALPVPDGETPEQAINRLERELKLVTEERDIIKKAIAYFAQPPEK